MAMRYSTLILLLALAVSLAQAQVTLEYQTTQPGLVSLGIYDGQGHLVRTLQSGKQQELGEYTLEWDGNDDNGNPCVPGQYELRGVVANLASKRQLTAGNPGNPACFTFDGKGAWNGHWGNPLALCSDDNAVYIQFSGEEAIGSLLKLDFEGNVQWKAHLWQGDGNGIQLAAATDGQYVYIAADVPAAGEDWQQRRSVVWRIKCDSGEYALWNGHGFFVGQPYTSGPIPFWEFLQGDMTTPPDVLGVEGGANVRGLAIQDGKLYVPLYRENKIEVWDAENPKLLSTIENLPKPQGIAVDTAGNLFVASETQVLKIVPAGAVSVAVPQGLVAPYGVALDAVGNLYVTDLGSSQQVKKFSAQGQLVWVSGKAGGRPWGGKHEPENFLMPAGLTVTKSGRIFVGENAVPRRALILDADGKLQKELMGTLDIGASIGIAADESDPTNVYCIQSYMNYLRTLNSIIRYKIDYDQETWQVDAYWAGYGTNVWPGQRSGLSLPDPRIIATGQSDLYVRHLGGRTYLCSGQLHNHGVWRVEGYRLIPAAAVGQMAMTLPVELDQGYTVDANCHIVARAGDRRQFTWHDADGDGLASEDEVTFAQFLDPNIPYHGHGSWGAYFDHQMNLYLPDEPGDGNVYKVPCTGVDDRGNPLYSWEQATVVLPTDSTFMAEAPYERFQPWDEEKAGQIYRKHVERIHLDTEGNVYGTTEIMGQDKGIGWASSTLRVKVGKWDPQGNLLWLVGDKATGFAKPGQFYTGKGVDGVIRGFVFFTDENGQSRIYTHDGLYAGSVPAADPYRGQFVEGEMLSIELCGARVFTHPQTGVDYYLAGDGAGLHFFKLEGLQDVERFVVPVDLTAASQGTVETGASAAAATHPLPTQGWEIVESAGDLDMVNLTAVAFGTPLYGALTATGGQMRVTYTQDGGLTWKAARMESDVELSNPFDVVFSDEKTGWLMGRFRVDPGQDRWNALLLKSDDAGATWKRVPLPPEVAACNLLRVWFDPHGHGWLFPYSYGAVARTADDGQTWQLVRLPPLSQGPSRSVGCYAFNPEHLVVGTNLGLLQQTRDGGATWTTLSTGIPDFDICGLWFADDEEGWAVGTKGRIMHTTDGGNTWTQQDSGVTNDLWRVQFVSPLEGYAVGGKPKVDVSGVLLHTADGGQTWRNVNPSSASLIGLCLLGPKYGWACGGRGGGYETPMMILRLAQQ